MLSFFADQCVEAILKGAEKVSFGEGIHIMIKKEVFNG